MALIRADAKCPEPPVDPETGKVVGDGKHMRVEYVKQTNTRTPKIVNDQVVWSEPVFEVADHCYHCGGQITEWKPQSA